MRHVLIPYFCYLLLFLGLVKSMFIVSCGFNILIFTNLTFMSLTFFISHFLHEQIISKPWRWLALFLLLWGGMLLVVLWFLLAFGDLSRF